MQSALPFFINKTAATNDPKICFKKFERSWQWILNSSYMKKCLHNQRDKRKFHIQAMNWIVILQGGEALNHIPF